MLAYKAEPEVVDMTRQAVTRALGTTHEARLTLAINGGDTFTVAAHERLDTTYWAVRLGLGQAYNQVVAATTESVICFLHNDCLVPLEPWLGKLTATAEKYGFAFPDVEDDTVPGVAPRIEGFPPSCCYAVSREAWNDLGGFDSIYEGCHFEDTDLFMRGIQKGYRMALVPDVKVHHKRGFTRSLTAEESNEAFQRNKQIYINRWQVNGETPLPSLEKING
jgi:GT2 family glycosyltransferase